MSKIAVSIVVPAYNEEKHIQNTLLSLSNSQQKTTITYEVIVVDNNSTDNTVNIALKYKNDLNLRIIKERVQGRGVARSRGFSEAKGDIVLSADADTIFYKGWIENLTNELKQDFVGVTTSCKIEKGDFLTRLIFNFSQPVIMNVYKILFGHYWLSGFSFGIKKSIYEKAGGFDNSLQAQEDIDLSFRVSKIGKIKFINNPVIVSNRRFKKGIILGYFEYVKSFFQVFFQKESVYLDNPR